MRCLVTLQGSLKEYLVKKGVNEVTRADVSLVCMLACRAVVTCELVLRLIWGLLWDLSFDIRREVVFRDDCRQNPPPSSPLLFLIRLC